MFTSFRVPPFFLFFIAPLGFLSYSLAYPLWAFSTLFLYFSLSFDKQQPRYAAFLTIFAPATIIAFATGQTGLLSSALIVGGFRLVRTRPILSGTLFGLASFKPQLGILIPIALISGRLWRTIAAACVTVFVLVLASGVAFGWSIWPLWFAKLLPHADWVMDVKDRYNPTITSSLTSIGVDSTVARSVQACVAVFVGVIMWICFRPGVTLLAIASLLVGTFLATPYAIVYDMPLLTSAVLLVLRDEEQTNRGLTIPELIILAATLVLPIIMAATWRPAMFRSIPLILLFGLIVWRIVRARRDFAESGAFPPRHGASVR
jgi:Glycosyltransferase family 87